MWNSNVMKMVKKLNKLRIRFKLRKINYIKKNRRARDLLCQFVSLETTFSVVPSVYSVLRSVVTSTDKIP